MSQLWPRKDERRGKDCGRGEKKKERKIERKKETCREREFGLGCDGWWEGRGGEGVGGQALV